MQITEDMRYKGVNFQGSRKFMIYTRTKAKSVLVKFHELYKGFKIGAMHPEHPGWHVESIDEQVSEYTVEITVNYKDDNIALYIKKLESALLYHGMSNYLFLRYNVCYTTRLQSSHPCCEPRLLSFASPELSAIRYRANVYQAVEQRLQSGPANHREI